MAVQISTPADPFALGPGGLVGHAPGWPTTDLMVINDNNKAQRNIHYPMVQSNVASEITFYFLIENASTYQRDMSIRYEASQEVLRSLNGMSVGEAGGRRRPFRSGDRITFARMEPGESRWLGLTVRGVSATKGKPLPVRFQEMAGERVLNGVSITVLPSPLAAVIRANLQFHLSVMIRLEAIFGAEAAHQEGLRTRAVLEREQIPGKAYISFFDLKVLDELIRIATDAIPTGFGILLDAHFKRLRSSLATGSTPAAAAAHTALLHTLDALLTTYKKSQGDVADIPLNMHWQSDLYTRLDSPKLKLAGSVASGSKSFIADYEARRITSEDYPSFIRELLPAFRETAVQLAKRGKALGESVGDMERSLDSPAALQNAHRRFLLTLQAYVPEFSSRLRRSRKK